MTPKDLMTKKDPAFIGNIVHTAPIYTLFLRLPIKSSEEDEESGSEYETDESDEPPPPPPPPRAVIEAPVSTLVARPSAPQGSSNRENGIAKAAMSLSEISDLPIPPATSPLKTAMSSTNDHLKHFNLQTHFVKEEENDESNENE